MALGAMSLFLSIKTIGSESENVQVEIAVDSYEYFANFHPLVLFGEIEIGWAVDIQFILRANNLSSRDTSIISVTYRYLVDHGQYTNTLTNQITDFPVDIPAGSSRLFTFSIPMYLDEACKFPEFTGHAALEIRDAMEVFISNKRSFPQCIEFVERQDRLVIGVVESEPLCEVLITVEPSIPNLAVSFQVESTRGVSRTLSITVPEYVGIRPFSAIYSCPGGEPALPVD